MSERTMKLAGLADEASQKATELRLQWEGAAAACARIRAAAPGAVPQWLAGELEAVPEDAWQAYSIAVNACIKAHKAYAAACEQERPYLKEQAAARAAEKAAAR